MSTTNAVPPPSDGEPGRGSLDGVELAMFVDPELAALDAVDTQPVLALFDEAIILHQSAHRLPGSDRPIQLHVHSGRGFVHLGGPRNWLDDVAGRWVAVKLIDDVLNWRLLEDEPTVDPDLTRSLRTTFDTALADLAEPTMPQTEGSFEEAERAEHLSTLSTGQLMAESVKADPHLWRRSPVPVTVALTAAGLSVHTFWVAHAGHDWQAADERQLRSRLAMRGLDPGQVEAAMFALASLAEGASAHVDAVIDALDDLSVAAVVRAEEQATLAETYTRGMMQIIGHLERRVDGEDGLAAGIRPGAGWVAASRLSGDGAPDRALVLLESAVRTALDEIRTSLNLDGETRGHVHQDSRLEHAEPLAAMTQDLAILKADADLLDEAHALFHIAEGLDPDNRSGWFSERLADASCKAVELAHASHPRNGPCPCGSGRKYKACHRGQPVLSLDDRASWLNQRVEDFTARVLADEELTAAYTTLGSRIFADDRAGINFDLVQGWRQSAIVTDAVLFGQGGLAQYRASVSTVLSDTDHQLLDEWERAPLRLLEVLSTGERSMTAEDLVTGETLTIERIEPSTQPTVDAIMVGRPLPADGRHRSFHGFHPVAADDVAAMVKALGDGDESAVRSIAARRYRLERSLRLT